ncbi:MAG: EamA family transporter [Acutalibacter sp.]|jgi:transporter family protein
MWILFAFGSAAFAGLTAILAKMGLKEVDSDLATALRTVVVLVFAWLMAFLTAGVPNLTAIGWNTYLFLVLSGLATGASWICYFKALQLGDVNKVAPIDKSSLLLTMILGVLLLGERLSWGKVGCMALIAAGTYLMIEKKRNVPTPRTTGKGWLFYAILSAVFAALTTILGKLGVEGIDSNLGTALRTVVVLIMAWAIVLAEGKQKDISRIDGRSWVFLVFSGVATGLSWLCYYRALQTGDASLVAPIDKLSLLFTVAFSGIFLKERLSAKSGVGLVLLTAGTLLLLVV